MNTLLSLVGQALHIALMLVAAPVLVGAVAWFEARLQGHPGPPVLQPWRDMTRALRRMPVLAEGTSWLMHAAPGARLAVLAVAAALVPGFTRDMALAPAADLLVIAGLLALARALSVLAAMDEGGAAAGHEAAAMFSRATLSAPALLLVIFALGLAAGDTGLASILGMATEDAPGWLLAALPLGLALVLVVAADGTGGATAEMSGRHEALAAAGDALRLTVWLALIAVLFLPPFLPPFLPAHLPLGRVDAAAAVGNWLIFLPAWLGKMALLAFGVAGARTLSLWPPARRVPSVLALATLLAVLGVVLLFAGQRQP